MGDVEEQKASVEEAACFQREGVWPSPVSKECCIYRVPNDMRKVNPDAYTPQMLLVGPLHHSKKADAAEIAKQCFPSLDHEQTKSRYLGYLNMEHQKKVYLDGFAKRVGHATLEHIKKTIEENEELIRQSYAESTDWIKSNEFLDMVLHDSVFILEFIFRHFEIFRGKRPYHDFLVDTPCLTYIVNRDLILLENQLPFFILEKIFDAMPSNGQLTFREHVLLHFGFWDEIKDTTTFKHFTDLSRCVRVETLDLTSPKNEDPKVIGDFYNACKLRNAGVTFNLEKQMDSLNVDFEEDTGCLKMSCMIVGDEAELTLRNIMAFEQCHCQCESYVCSYVLFLDFLIDTDKDVELLVEKGT